MLKSTKQNISEIKNEHDNTINIRLKTKDIETLSRNKHSKYKKTVDDIEFSEITPEFIRVSCEDIIIIVMKQNGYINATQLCNKNTNKKVQKKLNFTIDTMRPM